MDSISRRFSVTFSGDSLANSLLNTTTMFEIVNAQWLAADVKKFSIRAPKIARKRKPGQFVIIRIKENGERIPLTIVDSDLKEGTITLIVQGIGKTTKELNHFNTGDAILDLVGPLGTPSEIRLFGTAVSIGGGVGTAIAYPTAVALKRAGNHTISIIGARTKELVILENEMREVADEVYITTDDGSYGAHGLVTDQLRKLIEKQKIDFVIAIGPIPMMRAVADCTRPFGIKTVVSLNPIMVDGTGMCGGCRAVVDDKTVFVCVDGPEFDAHLVDFQLLDQRNRSYKSEERTSLNEYEHECASQTADGICQH
jgi:ferredoxin/flavodoxin---NADP+ reductase